MSQSDATTGIRERRKAPRSVYRAEGSLVIDGATDSAVARVAASGPHSETALAPVSRTLYLRDISPWAAGFIIGTKIPNLALAVATIPAPGGASVPVRCRIRRCRAFAPGWFEGVIEFEREQPVFSEGVLRAA